MQTSLSWLRITALVRAVLVAVVPITLGGCFALDQARSFTDRAVARYERFNLEVLVQAETERQRLRKARCHSPVLSPAAISAAAADPRLGPAWVEELLGDCPQYSAFISDLVLRRARQAGLLGMGPTR